MKERLQLLRQRLAEGDLEAALIGQPENRRYLSGFVGSAGYLLVSRHEALLAVDFRYVEQAGLQAPDFEVVRIQGDLERWLPGLAARLGVESLAFEADHLSFHAYQRVTSALKASGVKLAPTQNLVEGLRAEKDARELAHLERAAALADAAFVEVGARVEPGTTEREAAWRLERFLREVGSEPLPFDIIVASGPNAALPHAHPTDRQIQTGEPVLFDLGARVEGYASDLSRTLCLGSPDDTFCRVYDVVLGAQLAALATIGEGMTGAEADALARKVIQEAGYGEQFGHGLGHGVGLAGHEEPRLGPGGEARLSPGMVFTVEPGVYLPGWGGVRIEDVVVLEKGRTRPLTRAPKTESPEKAI